MHDALQDVDVASLWQLFEEAAGHDVAPVVDAGPFQQNLRPGQHVGLIEKDPAQVRVGGNDRRQQSTLTPSHVNHDSDFGKVIRGHDCVHDAQRVAGHCRVEDGVRFWMGGSIFPDGHPVEFTERRVPGSDAVEKVAPGVPEILLADVHRPRAHRAWRVRPQSFRERGLTDAPLSLRKHANAGESPQQPAQGRGVRAGRFRQLLDGSRAVF